MKFKVEILKDLNHIIDADKINESNKDYISEEVNRGNIKAENIYVCSNCDASYEEFQNQRSNQDLISLIISLDGKCKECNKSLKKHLKIKKLYITNVSAKKMLKVNKLLDIDSNITRTFVDELIYLSKRKVEFDAFDIKYQEELKPLRDCNLLKKLIDHQIINAKLQCEVSCELCDETMIVDYKLFQAANIVLDSASNNTNSLEFKKAYEELSNNIDLLYCDSNFCDEGYSLNFLLDKIKKGYVDYVYTVNI